MSAVREALLIHSMEGRRWVVARVRRDMVEMITTDNLAAALHEESSANLPAALLAEGVLTVKALPAALIENVGTIQQLVAEACPRNSSRHSSSNRTTIGAGLIAYWTTSEPNDCILGSFDLHQPNLQSRGRTAIVSLCGKNLYGAHSVLFQSIRKMPLTPCLVVPIELIRQKDRKTTQRFRGNEYQDRRKLLNYRDKETNEAGIVAYHAYRRKNAGIVADKVLGASQ